MIKRLSAPLCLALLSTSALAHPGAHDGIAAGQLADHVSTSAFHMGMMVAAALVVFALLLLGRQLIAAKSARRHR